MRTVKLVPGTAVKNLIASGADVATIAAAVRRDAESAGLTGEVGILIELDEAEKSVVPSQFEEVA